MKNLVIRKAAIGELAAIQAVARDVIRACYVSFLGEDRVAGFIESGQSDREFIGRENCLFALLEEYRIIGITICYNDVIHLFMIRPDAQGRGYGSYLLAWCEDAIRDRGFGAGRLETFVHNAQAVRFYRRNGWSETGRDGDEAGALARIRFEKHLD